MKKSILISAAVCLACLKGYSQAWTIPPVWMTANLASQPYLTQDKNNNYWLTGINGILKYNSSGITFFQDTLPPNHEGTCITVDTNFVVWMGTLYYGLIKFDGTNFSQYTTANSTLGSDNIKKVFTDRNNHIWVFDNSNTISMYNGISWIAFPQAVTGITGISSIDCDASNTIYFGTSAGIVKYDGTNWTSINTSNSNLAYNAIYDLHIAPDNSLWILTFQSLTAGTFMIGKYDGANFSYFFPSAGLINPYQFSIDEYNNIWTLGNVTSMDYGVFKFDQSSWQYYSNPYLPVMNGDFMFMSSNSNIWLFDSFLMYVFNENGFSNISGNVYNDLNGNGIKDNGEMGLPYFKIEIPGYGYALSDSSGNYHVSFNDSAFTYTLQLTPVNYWQQTTLPIAYSVTPLTDSLTGYDFGVQQMTNINDLSVSVSDFPMRAGSYVPLWITVQNSGSNYMNDTLTFTYDPSLTLAATSVIPDDSGGTTLKWYSSIGPGAQQSIQVLLHVDASATIGDSMYIYSSVSPDANDASPADNIYNYFTAIRGPFDPNCKTVFPEGNISQNQWLNYTICFQNTGTDTAFNVFVHDTLDANLNTSTLEITGSSYPVSYTLNGMGNLDFKFLNIQLPDSNINEPASHGFISYRIRPQSNLTNGTQIFNKAGIIFDFNSAAVTNETVNTIDNVLGIPEAEILPQDLKLYPNPAHNFFNISLTAPVKENYDFVIRDLNGRKIFTRKKMLMQGENNVKIDSGNLKSGLYIVTIKSAFEIRYASVIIN